jgi:methionyl-tRNA formyltransferase
VIEAPRLGIVNGHPSPLPRYRGPFPIAWAVRNGENEIGITYHLMDASFDTGNVLAQSSVPLDDDDTWDTVQRKTAVAGLALLPTVFERLARGERGEPQEGEGEYQSVFEDAYFFVDPARAALDIHRQVRAWGFVPPVMPQLGPLLERGDGYVRVTRSSLTDVDGAERLDCSDGPLWIVETEPARLPEPIR